MCGEESEKSDSDDDGSSLESSGAPVSISRTGDVESSSEVIPWVAEIISSGISIRSGLPA